MSSAARTNLTSQQVSISNNVLGEGAFRVCVEGTYIGGNRNQQEAACKRFKSQYRAMELDFFANDFRIIDKVVDMAEAWNGFCAQGQEILVNKGDVKSTNDGTRYLIEPLIRYYVKFNSNTGWIADTDDWKVRAMAAFSHFSYHRSGGQLLVCDLQGRFRHNKYAPKKSRFELTDPAICSRRRAYGPTDLAEKGIESFFASHECSEFCQSHWQRPRNARQWYPQMQGTSMMTSAMTQKLMLTSRATFRTGFNGIMEEDSDDGDY
jgi:hypothetical protein